MSAVRTLLLALIALVFATQARATEQINSFDVRIEVERDGDIVVTETIEVLAEGAQIQRGIFRDLPRFYESEGARLPYDYAVLGVRRDNSDEPYKTSEEDNAFRIRIGDPNTFLDHGAHRYELRYQVKNQVRYFETYDEVYWSVTGNYWAFPIKTARATIVLPAGARIVQHAGYTGRLGAAGADFAYTPAGETHVFETTRALDVEEGFTVALGFEKGLIDPPSASDHGMDWWRRYGSLAFLVSSVGGLFWFLYRGFTRVGRDPPKGPVFPRYEAPAGYSPAAVHFVYNRVLSGHRALIATIMNLAVRGRLNIDASDKNATVLSRAQGATTAADLPAEDLDLERALFAGQDTRRLGERYDASFTSAYRHFQIALGRKYGAAYFRWNIAYTALAVVATILVIVFAAAQTVQWSWWHTLGVVALAALNLAFMYFMPAPTRLGQEVRTEIEGFKLYMETAEKLQLNAVEVGSEAPPPMTVERYEKFLPYAVALGVEAPWTRHFERLIPEAARAYHPTWTNTSGAHSLSGLSTALVANMSSGVQSAMPQSSGSSGSGGGGSSGGGGGGGGGGGW